MKDAQTLNEYPLIRLTEPFEDWELASMVSGWLSADVVLPNVVTSDDEDVGFVLSQ